MPIMNDELLEKLLVQNLREWLKRRGVNVERSTDKELLRRVGYTFQDTRSSLARGDK